MRELVALLLLSCEFIVAVYVLWLFLVVPCVTVVFSDHTYFFIICKPPKTGFLAPRSNYKNSVFQTDVFPSPVSGGRQLLHLAQLTKIRFH